MLPCLVLVRSWFSKNDRFPGQTSLMDSSKDAHKKIQLDSQNYYFVALVSRFSQSPSSVRTFMCCVPPADNCSIVPAGETYEWQMSSLDADASSVVVGPSFGPRQHVVAISSSKQAPYILGSLKQDNAVSRACISFMRASAPLFTLHPSDTSSVGIQLRIPGRWVLRSSSTDMPFQVDAQSGSEMEEASPSDVSITREAQLASSSKDEVTTFVIEIESDLTPVMFLASPPDLNTLSLDQLAQGPSVFHRVRREIASAGFKKMWEFEFGFTCPGSWCIRFVLSREDGSFCTFERTYIVGQCSSFIVHSICSIANQTMS